MKIRQPFKFVAACVFLGSVSIPLISTATATVEQINGVLTERSIPYWKKEMAQIKELRMSPPNPIWNQNWSGLDTIVKTVSGSAALTKASAPQDVNELFSNAAWLRWKVLADGADGRYSYIYALLLSHMAGPDGDYTREAVVFFLHARLALAIDGARCVDGSSPGVYVSGYESQSSFKRLIEKVEKMPVRARAVAAMEAIAIEEMRGERAPFEWLCTAGIKTSIQAVNQGRQFQKIEANADGNSKINGAGNTYAIDTTDISPNYIPENQWKKTRREMLDQSRLRISRDL